MLSWWDESPTWLAGSVASMANVCDHVVALDGRYRLYDDHRVQSGAAQVDAVVEAARATGMGLTLHTAPRVWETEMDKRTHLFRLGALEAETFRDWFFVLDADELLIRAGRRLRSTLQDLADNQQNVGVARLFEEADPHESDVRSRISNTTPVEYTYTSPTPRFYRALEDIRVSGCHYYYTGEDERGMRVALWGQQKTREADGQVVVLGDQHDPAEPGLTPWHHFADDEALIENRCLQRAQVRTQRRQDYYETRDAAGIEHQTMIPLEGMTYAE